MGESLKQRGVAHFTQPVSEVNSVFLLAGFH